MPDKLAPFRLGRYDCIELIGMGGMASVYRARLNTVAGFHKDYAIKKIYSHLAEQAHFLDMFIHEASLAARLDHGNIARILELNEDNGTYYMVLEYIDGVTLRQFLDMLSDRGQTMPWHMACFVAMEAARALHYAHTATDDDGRPLGLVHRDVSPSNIMLSRRGQVKVLDFGIAKALLEPGTQRSTELKGKYEYMSPEQVRGEVLDCRSDIFALGSLLYEMLTGKALFDAETIPGILTKVQKAEVPPLPGVEPLLEPVLHRMLSLDTSQRYSSADEVRSILAQILMVRGRFVDETNLAAFLTQALDTKKDQQRADQTEEYGEPTTPDRKHHVWDSKDPDTEERTIPRSTSNDVEVDSMIATKPMFMSLAITDDNEEPEESTATSIQDIEGHPRRSLSPSLLHIHEHRTGRPTPDELPPAPLSVTPPPKLQIPPLKVVSSSEPEYPLSPDHFTPRMETVPVAHEDPPETWTSRHVLILVLAILSMVVAGSAVYLAWAQNRSEEETPPPSAQWQKNSRKHAVESKNIEESRGTSGPIAHRQTAGPMQPDVTVKRTHGRPPRTKTRLEYMGESSRSPHLQSLTAQSPSARHTTDDGPLAVEHRGGRAKTDVDIITKPKGANVLCGRKRMGKTPLRIRLPRKGACELILNLPLHRVVERRLTRSRWGGRRFVQYLPLVPSPARIARRGTSIDTKCHGPAVYRIFLNGRDTGRNCPVRLRLPPGTNDLSIHLSRSRRLFYKKFRLRGGQTEIVEWTDRPQGKNSD